MFARVARYDVEPDRTGEAIEAFRGGSHEAGGLERPEGRLRARGSGRTGSSCRSRSGRTGLRWTTAEEWAAALRQEAAKAVDGNVVSVHNLDVPIEIGTAVSSSDIARSPAGVVIRRSSTRTWRRRVPLGRVPAHLGRSTRNVSLCAIWPSRQMKPVLLTMRTFVLVARDWVREWRHLVLRDAVDRDA